MKLGNEKVQYPYLTLALSRCQSVVSGRSSGVVLIGRASVAAVVWHFLGKAYLV